MIAFTARCVYFHIASSNKSKDFQPSDLAILSNAELDYRWVLTPRNISLC
jgi:hypothetical protein